MEKYVINYNTGAGNEVVEVNNLGEAKEIAKDGMRYTQMHVNIEDMEGNIVAISRWYGVNPEEVEDADVIEVFGDSGFYSGWEEQ